MYSNYLDLDHPQTTKDLLEGVITYYDRVITIPNNAGRASQSLVVTPGVGTQEVTTYKLTELTTGRTISVISDASPTAQEVSDLIRAAWKADSVLNGLASVAGTTTVTFTNRGTASGIQIALADGGSTPTNVLTVANTAAATGSNIVAGRGLSVGATGVFGVPSAALSGSNIFAGITGFSLADFQSDPNFGASESAYYTPTQAVNLLKRGQIAIKPLTAVDPTMGVYLSYDTANGTNGQFRGSSASNYSQITSGLSWATVTPLGGIALLDVNLP